MNINQWLRANKDEEERERVAKEAGTSLAYLKRLSSSKDSKASPQLAERLAKASEHSPGGAMTEMDILYPDRAEEDAA